MLLSGDALGSTEVTTQYSTRSVNQPYGPNLALGKIVTCFNAVVQGCATISLQGPSRNYVNPGGPITACQMQRNLHNSQIIGI